MTSEFKQPVFVSIEAQIARAVLEALDAADIPYSIDYERGYAPSGTTNEDPIEKRMEELFACDEAYIMTGKTDKGEKYNGFITLIWGNDFYCISDYSIKLEDVLAPILKAIEEAENV